MRWVDEIGEPIPDIEVVFSISGSRHKSTTDRDGVARYTDPGGSGFAWVEPADLGALRDALGPRWDTIRAGDVLTDGDAHVVLLHNPVEGISLVADELETLSVQPYVERVRLLDEHFESSKSFLLPDGLAAARAILTDKTRLEACCLHIVGHTDTSGRDDYNEKLSLERAEALRDYLIHNVEGWIQYYNSAIAPEKRWGTREDYRMLGALPDFSPDLSEESPIRWYQRTRGLKNDGIAGPITRAQLIKEYMAMSGAPLPASVAVTIHGCGERFPLEATGDSVANSQNRRVEAYFFDKKLRVQPPPPRATSKAGSLQYPEWVKRSRRTEDYRARKVPPEELTLEFHRILGLYRPGVDDRVDPAPGTSKLASYQPGYASEDDRGRIYMNHLPDGTWQQHQQYVEILVHVRPMHADIPPGSTIIWTVEDPDDPSDEDPRMDRAAGALLDPSDHAAGSKTGAAPDDNDPYHRAQQHPHFAPANPAFPLADGETPIDADTHISKVRFHVSDIAGDNYRIKAQLKTTEPTSTPAFVESGVVTVWRRIQVEYVRMASADELRFDEVTEVFDRAFAQIDVAKKRVVTGRSDIAHMGSVQRIHEYATRAGGEFTMDGKPGWFFVAAANRFWQPVESKILYEGTATALGDIVQLPDGVVLPEDPAAVRIFKPGSVSNSQRSWPADRNSYITFSALDDKVKIIRHDFYHADDPNTAFLLADLGDYGFTKGTEILVQVIGNGDGGGVMAGYSPGGADRNNRHYFGGRVMVFTGIAKGNDATRVLCHELCHAFDNAHKCDNWSWMNDGERSACCMNYQSALVLDNEDPRAPIPWTQNHVSIEMCAPHLRRMRDYHMEDNPGLGW